MITKQKQDYGYDQTSQLVSAEYDTLPSEAYEYDANGNRKSHLTGTPGYTTGKNNQLLSDGVFDYTYDDEGNRIAKTAKNSRTEYFWDHRNRLVKVVDNGKSVEYDYDHQNRLVCRNDELFVHDGWQVACSINNGKIEHRYLWGAMQDELLAIDDQWTLRDHLNTVRKVIDARGCIVASLEYNAFGALVDTTGEKPLFRYTGKLFDDATGLQWNINRWYDSVVGRWISEDPIGFKGGEVNLYRYVNNSSLKYTDVQGLQKTDEQECEYYLKLAEKFDHPIVNEGGFILCREGRKIVCVNIPAIQIFVCEAFSLGTPQTALDIIEDCTRQHEQFHIDSNHGGDCPENAICPHVFRSPEEAEEGECEAHKLTVDCLSSGNGKFLIHNCNHNIAGSCLDASVNNEQITVKYPGSNHGITGDPHEKRRFWMPDDVSNDVERLVHILGRRRESCRDHRIAQRYFVPCFRDRRSGNSDHLKVTILWHVFGRNNLTKRKEGASEKLYQIDGLQSGKDFVITCETVSKAANRFHLPDFAGVLGMLQDNTEPVQAGARRGLGGATFGATSFIACQNCRVFKRENNFCAELAIGLRLWCKSSSSHCMKPEIMLYFALRT